MTEQAEHPGTEQPAPNTEPNTRVRRLSRARTVMLAGVGALPPAVNAQNIVEWAHSPNGLNLPIVWAWLVFAGLDLTALVCVLETLIQTERGRKAGAFAALVWAFALASAYAGYRHGTQPNAGRDVKWFFPFLSIAGPAILHLILKRSRLDKQVDEGRRLTYAPAGAYGWKRWMPVIGAFTETFGSWRVGHLEGIVRPLVAIERYRALRPNAGRSGLRVLRALRVEAEQRRVNSAPARITRTGDVQPNTGPAVAPNKTANTRAPKLRPNIPSKPAGGASNGDVEANTERIKAHWRDWASNMPGAREIARFLGAAPSTGLSYRNRLLAEATDAEERAS